MNMETPERGRREVKLESVEEQDQLEQLEADVDAARVAGVYDPSEVEGGI